MKPQIDIDENSGFCFGVTTAITTAEKELEKAKTLYCLGDIVHNSAEMHRLSQKGLVTINHNQFKCLDGVKVLLRAHGEPPLTYAEAQKRGIELVDATCPVVLRLQQRIKKAYNDALASGKELQIVIYGQPGHAEVNGLVGQTEGTAIVIEGPDQLDKINLNKNIALYSQTTKSLEGFSQLIDVINRIKSPHTEFTYFDTICRQVANRVNGLREFAASHDVVLFVAGEKSSNGKILFNHCHSVNQSTYMLSSPADLCADWFNSISTIGICGATSTPRWLMEDVATAVMNLVN